ncbi:transposase [Arthrobacter sp. NPDC080031]|uniref:IS110 family transposase n=1 Tax=Arthrobacter sp. NPDC080031 TaxID=3155918 RepID=UPI00344B961E
MPHTLRSLDRDSEVLAALKVLSGFDADLTHECTRAINRLRSLLLQIFPALERVFPGTVLTRSLVLRAVDQVLRAVPGCELPGGPMCCAGPETTAGRIQ